MEIKYLTYQQINKKKWDACIDKASNGLIYACSAYLDGMAGEWDALVLNDYELIMPLPGRKKYGIHYLFQPFVTPSLGVFGNGVTPEIINAFLNVMPNKFKVWDVSFNSSNKILYSKGTIVNRTNYVLDLNHSYTLLQQNYSNNINRNITKALKSGCIVKKQISFDEVAVICKKEFPKFTEVENGLFEKLHEVYKAYTTKSAAYGIFTKEEVLLASCIFLFFKNRVYYWLVGNTPESKQYGASSLLVDSFIKEYAGKNLLLDFEGSDTESVGDFYKKFGATLEPYATLYVNKLPFPFSLAKPLPQHYKALVSK